MTTWSDIRVRGVPGCGGEQSSLQEHLHTQPGGAQQQQPGGGGERQEEKQEIKQPELQRSRSYECLLSICSSKKFIAEF